MSIAVTSSLAPTTADTPLDARAVVATVSDIASLQMPYIGMLVYCKATSKYYTVTALTSRTTGTFTVQNAAVGSYAEFPAPPASSVASDGSSPVAGSAVYVALGGKMDVVSGGSAGQVLGKTSSGYAWVTPSAGSSGGSGGSSPSSSASGDDAMLMALIFG